MTRHPDADWIVEGAAVVETSGAIPFAELTFTTIQKLSPLWITLANGHRYYATTMRRYGSAAEREVLLPADDPGVRDILARLILSRTFAKVYAVARTQQAESVADVLAVLGEVERAVQQAKVAATADDVMDVARFALPDDTKEN